MKRYSLLTLVVLAHLLSACNNKEQIKSTTEKSETLNHTNPFLKHIEISLSSA